MEVEEEEDWVIDRILRKDNDEERGVIFLVLWEGYGEDAASWHSESELLDDDIAGVDEAIAAYKASRLKKKKKPKSEDRPMSKFDQAMIAKEELAEQRLAKYQELREIEQEERRKAKKRLLQEEKGWRKPSGRKKKSEAVERLTKTEIYRQRGLVLEEIRAQKVLLGRQAKARERQKAYAEEQRLLSIEAAKKAAEDVIIREKTRQVLYSPLQTSPAYERELQRLEDDRIGVQRVELSNEERVLKMEVEAIPLQPRKPYQLKKVPSLWRLALKFICQNLDLYEGFEYVPVSWKAKMYAHLANRNQLSTENVLALLDPEQKYIDLSVCSVKQDRALRKGAEYELGGNNSPIYDIVVGLKKAPGLETIILKNSLIVVNLALSSLFKTFQSLKTLDLSGSYRVDTIGDFKDLSPSLTSLDFSGKRRSRVDLSLMPMSSFEGNCLTYLNLSYTEVESLAWLDGVVSRSPHLVTLLLEEVSIQESKSIPKFQGVFEDPLDEEHSRPVQVPLRTLVMTLVGRSDPFYEWFLGRFADSLVNISLEGCSYRLFMFLTDGKMKSLKEVSVQFDGRSGIPQKVIPLGALSNQLTFLSLGSIGWLQKQTFYDIFQCSFLNLKKFIISDAFNLFLPEFLEIFKKTSWPSLEELTISKCLSSTYNTSLATLSASDIDWNAFPVARFPNLRSLSLNVLHRWMSPTVYERVVNGYHFPRLTHLNLDGMHPLVKPSTLPALQFTLNAHAFLTTLVIPPPVLEVLLTLQNGAKIHTLELIHRQSNGVSHSLHQLEWGELARAFPRLSNLSIVSSGQNLYRYRDHPCSLSKIGMSTHPTLERLHLSRIFLRLEVLARFIHNTPSLQTLYFDSFSAVHAPEGVPREIPTHLGDCLNGAEVKAACRRLQYSAVGCKAVLVDSLNTAIPLFEKSSAPAQPTSPVEPFLLEHPHPSSPSPSTDASPISLLASSLEIARESGAEEDDDAFNFREYISRKLL